MKLKSYVLALTFISFATISHSQDVGSMNKLSFGLQIGGHDAVVPVKTTTKFFTHVNGEVRYMLNNRFGVMGDIGYENFGWKGESDGIKNTQLLRFSLQGVANLGDILRFSTWTDRFGLLAHGGAGYSRMWQVGAYTFGESDQMGNFIAGLTPQFKINDRVSICLDWSGVFNANQNNRFDFKSKNSRKGNGVNAFYMTAAIGANIYIGKNKSHADWTPTVYGGGNNESLISRLEELEERMKDNDGDGVVNGRDLEPNSPEGAIVNSKGVEINVPLDSDNDGIVDEFDSCPKVKGLFSTNGCPDTDKDGVSDEQDECPNVAGLISNNGCPEVDEETKKVFDEALHGIKFETGKAVIKSLSYPILQKVVDVMNGHSEFKLEIHGHTDNVGNPESNQTLSEDRAEAVKAYLISKGITEGRLNAFGHGDSQPSSTNETSEGRADNRRVEFRVKF